MSPEEIQQSKDKIDRELRYMRLINKHDTEMQSKAIMIVGFTIFGFLAGLIIGRIL